jgi:hypothetical protein
MPPEVLIYVQSVKRYLETNKDAYEYFLNGVDSELFYKHLSEISEKNYQKNGEVMLDKQQFEILKKTIRALMVSEKENITKEESINENIFFEIKGFGKICLN